MPLNFLRGNWSCVYCGGTCFPLLNLMPHGLWGFQPGWWEDTLFWFFVDAGSSLWPCQAVLSQALVHSCRSTLCWILCSCLELSLCAAPSSLRNSVSVLVSLYSQLCLLNAWSLWAVHGPLSVLWPGNPLGSEVGNDRDHLFADCQGSLSFQSMGHVLKTKFQIGG